MANFEIVNKAMKPIFSSSKDQDLAIYTDTSNNAIHIGCGSNLAGKAQVSISPSNLLLNNDQITVGGHIVPMSNLVYDLGSSTLRFRDLYLSGNTIDFGGTKLSVDSESNFSIYTVKNNSNVLAKLAVNEVQIGLSNAVKIKRDNASGKFKFYDVSTNGVETVNNSIAGGLTFASLGPSVITTGGGVPAVPTVNAQFVPVNPKVSYGRLVLNAHNGVSMNNGASFTAMVTHNFGHCNYYVYAVPQNGMAIKVKVLSIGLNSFQIEVSNIAGSNLLKPVINYQIVQSTESSNVSTVLASPVSIALNSGSLTTFSGSNSISKVFTLSNHATDPQGYDIRWSKVSDTTNRVSISGSNVIYNHARITTSGTFVAKAFNDYVDDVSKTVTFAISETYVNNILEATPSNITTTQNSWESGEPGSSNLPSIDQGYPLTWSTVTGSNTLSASLNGNVVSWTSAGSTGSRNVLLNASFSNSTIMTEAALAAKAIRLTVSETLLALATSFASGNVRYMTRITGSYQDYIQGLAALTDGSVIVSGQSYGSTPCTLYNALGTVGTFFDTSYTTTGFIAKYNNTGNLVWSTTNGTNYKVAASSYDSGFVATNFSVNRTTIYKYDTNGAITWSANVDSTSSIQPSDIAAGSDGSTVCLIWGPGTISAKTVSGTTVRSYSDTNNGYGESYMVRYAANGTSLWFVKLGIVSTTGVLTYWNSAGISANGNVFSCGAFAGGNVYLYSANGSATLVMNGGSQYTGFICMYSSTGGASWFKTTNTGEGMWFSKAIGTSDNFGIFAGIYRGVAVIDNYTFTSASTTGENNAYLLKYNSSGTFQYYADIHSTIDVAVDDMCNLGDGGFAVTCRFKGTLSLKNSNTHTTVWGSYTSVNNSGHDVITIRYSSTLNPVAIISKMSATVETNNAKVTCNASVTNNRATWTSMQYRGVAKGYLNNMTEYGTLASTNTSQAQDYDGAIIHCTS